jgi:hypothetical protein
MITPKRCRERWFNHLNPYLNKGKWKDYEDSFILSKQREWGNKWSKIAKELGSRSDHSVKNRWY